MGRFEQAVLVVLLAVTALKVLQITSNARVERALLPDEARPPPAAPLLQPPPVVLEPPAAACHGDSASPANVAASPPPAPRSAFCDANTLSLFSRRVVTSAGTFSAVVHVVNGVVSSVEPASSPPPGSLDFSPFVLSPGLIDVHAHMDEPGRTHWEGFRTGTASAAAGCLTTLIEQPLNSVPATTTASALAEKLAAAGSGEDNQLSVDVAFWGGLVPSNARDPAALTALLSAGVVGLKAFMSPSGVDEFDHASVDDLRSAMPALAAAHKPLMVHAELPSPLDDHTAALIAVGDATHHSTWALSRPIEWEAAALDALLSIAHPAVRIHVAHVSAASTAATIRGAVSRGLNVSGETCAHYLTWTTEDVPRGETRLKCAPPLRAGEANREGLWSELKYSAEAPESGGMRLMGSDHSPSPPDMKLVDASTGLGDFVAAWGGVASLQLSLPAFWEGARNRGFTPSHLAQLWSAQPADLVGLGGTKGRVAPGGDADFCIWDPDAEVAPGGEGHTLYHRHAGTPYDGRVLHGRVVATFLRGAKVFDVRGGVASATCGRPILVR